MFRVLDVGADGAPRLSDGADAVGPPPDDVLRWVDLAEQDAEALALLKERFRFHPLAIEDCAHFGQRPKLEEYQDHLFVVIHALSAPPEGGADIEPLELHAFLSSRYLVTVHARPIPGLEAVWKRLATDPAPMRRGADFAYYLVADAVVDANFPLLDRIGDQLEELEEAVLGRAERHHMEQMFALRRALVTMRKLLSPQRDTFGLLTKRGSAIVSERTALYFRDVYDHLVRIHESIEASRDLLGNALDAYLTTVSNRTNEIMKKLTILSAIFLPLTFVTGFFGQNFDELQSDRFMYFMLAACALLPTGMLYWFKKSQWL